MKLFKTKAGMIIAFGFDPIAREANPRIIAWNDPASGSWEATAKNMAGRLELPAGSNVNPEFVRQINGGTVIAYQPGMCIELCPAGPERVWDIRFLQSE